MLTIQNYKKVESLEEAYELNQKKANRIVGGMMWMRMGDNRMNTAIDMSGLGLDKIEESDEQRTVVAGADPLPAGDDSHGSLA